MKTLATGSALVLLALAVYAFGILLEFEYPHWPLLYQVSHAKSAARVPVREILERKYGKEEANEAHWHTCGYCIRRQGPSEDLVSVELYPPRGRSPLRFAYSRQRNEIVPASDAAAAVFPELMPAGDTLVGARSGISIGGVEEVKIPRKWAEESFR